MFTHLKDLTFLVSNLQIKLVCLKICVLLDSGVSGGGFYFSRDLENSKFMKENLDCRISGKKIITAKIDEDLLQESDTWM